LRCCMLSEDRFFLFPVLPWPLLPDPSPSILAIKTQLFVPSLHVFFFAFASFFRLRLVYPVGLFFLLHFLPSLVGSFLVPTESPRSTFLFSVTDNAHFCVPRSFLGITLSTPFAYRSGWGSGFSSLFSSLRFNGMEKVGFVPFSLSFFVFPSYFFH